MAAPQKNGVACFLKTNGTKFQNQKQLGKHSSKTHQKIFIIPAVHPIICQSCKGSQATILKISKALFYVERLKGIRGLVLMHGGDTHALL